MARTLSTVLLLGLVSLPLAYAGKEGQGGGGRWSFFKGKQAGSGQGGTTSSSGNPQPPEKRSTTFMTFPSLANMMAEAEGIKRPARIKLAALGARPDPNSLPGSVLATVVERMGRHANWATVAYAASNHRTVGDKVRAEWAKEDARADMNETLDQLTPTQRAIAHAAFDGGMADLPPDVFPATVTLDWVQQKYPARQTRW